MESLFDQIIKIDCKRSAGEALTTEEKKQWNDWLASHPIRDSITIDEEELKRMGRFDRATESAWKAFCEVAYGEMPESKAVIIDQRKEFRFPRKVWRIAAVLLALALCALWYLRDPRSPDKGSTVATATNINTLQIPNGQKRRLVLSDGSSVWLNAGSSLRYPPTFDDSIRSVELVGEAYFEIARGKPFVVTIDSLSIAVLGTHFNVKAHKGQGSTIVTLLEGAVLVRTPSISQHLQPMQQLTITSAGIQLQSNIKKEETLGWKENIFQYHRKDIKTIMDEVSRWYNKKVIYEKVDSVAEFEVDRVSRDLPLYDVLAILKKTGSVDFNLHGDTIWVLNKD